MSDRKSAMVDENYFRKLRNLISTCPKSDFSWSELAAGDKTLPAADNTYEATRRLVTDFLNLVSGGQVRFSISITLI